MLVLLLELVLPIYTFLNFNSNLNLKKDYPDVLVI
jgi:hypothetical protein